MRHFIKPPYRILLQAVEKPSGKAHQENRMDGCLLRSESERILVEIEANHNEKRVNNPYQVKKRVKNGFCWAWPPSPSPLFEQPFEILSRGYHERLTVDPPQPTQAKASHAMPVFSLRKERFHPDLSLTQGFLVGCGWLIGTHPFQTGFIDTAAEAASLFARRTLGFECAVIAVPGAG